jgi:hypothetical protein
MKLRPSPLLQSRAPHRLAWLAALLSGCFHPTFDRLTCSARGECPGGFTCSASRICEPSDGGITPPDAPNLCFGSLSLSKVCFTSLAKVPTNAVELTADTEINTDTSPLCHPDNDKATEYCVVAGTGFTLAAGKKIRAYGTKPLVLLSTTTMQLDGEVDVSSNHVIDMEKKHVGAGSKAAAADCPGTTEAVTTSNSGGFGGSFGGKGGDGQNKDGVGGIAASAITSFPSVLRGGCPGGAGAASRPLPVTPGAGGAGGGAVALIAATRITFGDKINASGAGGLGGCTGLGATSQRSGGGGGGSGGMIVLDAPAIVAVNNGVVFANGGGGAEGGAGPSGSGVPEPGAPGNESTAPTTPGTKGTGHEGGDGGDGSAGSLTGGQNAAGQEVKDGGGGAGGGGAGIVHAPMVPSEKVAPPSSNP